MRGQEWGRHRKRSTKIHNPDCKDKRITVINYRLMVKAPAIRLDATDLTNRTTTFMMDTGSEINIIKRNVIKDEGKINSKETIRISGITSSHICTESSLNIDICGKQIHFHLVEATFPIEHDGIL